VHRRQSGYSPLEGLALTQTAPFTGDAGYVLGETAQPVRVSHAAEIADAALALARQARHGLRIFTRDLDAGLYDSEAFCDAVTRLARANRYAFVRIVVQDPTPAIKDGHRLVGVVQHLTSHIGVRRAAQDWQNEVSAGLLADEQGLLWRADGGRYEGTVDFKAGPKARDFRQWFDPVWESSETDPEFRRLLI
jgi:hypothetical protein